MKLYQTLEEGLQVECRPAAALLALPQAVAAVAAASGHELGTDRCCSLAPCTSPRRSPSSQLALAQRGFAPRNTANGSGYSSRAAHPPADGMLQSGRGLAPCTAAAPPPLRRTPAPFGAARSRGSRRQQPTAGASAW